MRPLIVLFISAPIKVLVESVSLLMQVGRIHIEGLYIEGIHTESIHIKGICIERIHTESMSVEGKYIEGLHIEG